MKYLFKLLIILLLVSYSSCLIAKEITVEYKKHGENIEVFGHSLKPTQKIGDLNPEHGGAWLIFNQSPDEKWVIVFLKYFESADIWLYDNTSQTINKLPNESGRHTSIRWIKNHIFKLSWGGMGYSVDRFYRIDNISNVLTDEIVNLEFYDFERNIFVSSFYENGKKFGILVREPFSKNITPEKFYIDLPRLSEYDPRPKIDSIQIVKNSIHVNFTKDKKKQTEIVYPILLNTND